MSEQKKVTVKCECSDCGGTGLYVGWTCHDGAAVVCGNCGGTGYREISYTPFTSRKERKGIKRVFEAMSYRHFYPEKHTFEDGVTTDFSQFGCTFDEWKNGATPKPMPE